MGFLNENNHLLFIMQFVLLLVVVGAWVYLAVNNNSFVGDFATLAKFGFGFFFGAQVTEMVQKGKAT